MPCIQANEKVLVFELTFKSKEAKTPITIPFWAQTVVSKLEFYPMMVSGINPMCEGDLLGLSHISCRRFW